VFTRRQVGGEGILFDEFRSYPVPAFSWATVPGNPSLADVHRRTGRAVVGGFPAKPYISSMTAESLAGRARQAIAEMKGRWLLLGPDCSINPDTPEPLLHAAGAAARAPRRARRVPPEVRTHAPPGQERVRRPRAGRPSGNGGRGAVAPVARPGHRPHGRAQERRHGRPRAALRGL